MPRVQAAALIYRNKRVATLQNVTYRVNTGDTQEKADSGTYNTDGIPDVEVSCDTIVPVEGVGVPITRDALEHEDVNLSLGIVDGTIHELIGCRAREMEFASEVATGKQTGRFTWFGPKPRIIG